MVFGVLIATLLLPNYTRPVQAAPGQQDSPVETVRAAAVGTTYTVTSTGCTGPGSFVEAVELANAKKRFQKLWVRGLVRSLDGWICRWIRPRVVSRLLFLLSMES